MNNNTKNDKELEFNRKNREDYEQLMSDSSTNLDGYWDRKNPFVIIILFVLAVVIVVGSIYYITTYINTVK